MGRVSATRLRALLDYDPSSGIFRWLRGTNRTPAGSIAGSLNRDGFYRRIRVDNRDYSANRLAIYWMSGKYPKHQVLHLNGNFSDHRFENLKRAPRSRRTRNGLSKNPFPQRDDSPPGQVAPE
jgi:hypothetical protein